MRFLVFTILFSAGLAACAPTQPQPAPAQAMGARTPNRCFDTEQVLNFQFDSTSRLLVRSRHNDVHEITFTGLCRISPASPMLRIRTWLPFFSRACVNDTVTVRSLSQRGDSCQGRVTQSLTDQQIAELPSRLRP